MYNDAQSSIADIIYGSQTELQKQVVMSDRAEIRMECECDVLESRSTPLSFFLLCLLSYHFK